MAKFFLSVVLLALSGAAGCAREGGKQEGTKKEIAKQEGSKKDVAKQEVTKTWEGKWVNKKYSTQGTMTCVAKEGKDGTWSATFSGAFMGEKFSFDVDFQAKPGKDQSDLSGTATVRNAKYEWTGAMKGDKLTGTYTANNGYNGDFELKEVKPKK